MQVNSIGGYNKSRTNNLNKTNIQSQPTFGRIKWEPASKAYEREINYEIHNFFHRMDDIGADARFYARQAAKVAKNAYSSGKAMNFEKGEEIYINNTLCRIYYSSDNDNRYAKIYQGSDCTCSFTYDKNTGETKEITAKSKDTNYNYSLKITADKTVFEREYKNTNTGRRYTIDENGSTYEENVAFSSGTYISYTPIYKGVTKGFKKTFQIGDTFYERKPFSSKWEIQE